MVLREHDNDTKVTLNKGDILQIELKRSGGTGYEWHLDETYKSNFELIKEDTEEITREGFVGTPVTRRWQLRAIKQGDTELTLLLFRDWEGKSKSASRFTVRIIIK
jgi:predicted secreted protein